MSTKLDLPLQGTLPRQRSPRYLFLAKFKMTDLISGLQVEGLTTDLSQGGCCVMTRRGPFSAGTEVLLEIKKDGVSLAANATVVYNLKDRVMGLSFAEMSAKQTAILEKWLKAAMPPSAATA